MENTNFGFDALMPQEFSPRQGYPPSGSLMEDTDSQEEVPFLIDATLPVLKEINPQGTARYSKEWRETMAGIGVGKVKMATTRLHSSDAVVGLDGALLGDYPKLFRDLRGLGISEMVFGNRLGLATALAAAWLEEGGVGVVASFGGSGGLPVLEELRLMLHTSGMLPLIDQTGKLKRLRELHEYMTGRKTLNFKPVVGSAIFAVESGVHVDGVSKDPSLYEPFSPELVGGERYLSVGLKSGRRAIQLKCEALKLEIPEGTFEAELLYLVRERSLKLLRGLTDGEFLRLFGMLTKKKEWGALKNVI